MACSVATDILPGVLAYAPGADGSKFTGTEEVFASALNLCELNSPDSNVEKGSALYSVTHYTEAACGRAFGPLGLCQVLRFCRSVVAKLEKLEGLKHRLVLGSPAGDEEAHTNASVLVGAYLLLGRSWTVAQVTEALRKTEAERCFACSWARKDRPEPKRNMKVSDCWLGLELMRNHGWFDPTCLTSDVGTDFVCSKLRNWATTYDASWLIPGCIMVCADPVTTALDPNPATFKDLLPKDGKILNADREPDPTSPKSCPGTPMSLFSTKPGSDGSPNGPFGNLPMATIQSESCGDPDATPKARTNSDTKDITPMARIDDELLCSGENESTDTVCKEYRLAFHAPTTDHLKPLDFVSFVKQSGVGLFVRTNFSAEPGMPKAGSYDPKDLAPYGLEHVEIQVVDQNGGLPRRSDVAKILQACPNLVSGSDGRGVVVHCKGGFGRSVVLACCLAIDQFDIPGRALLGWVRIARPGSVNTPQQELFLQGLNGRADVRRFAGLKAQSGEDSEPAPCCSVQ